MIRSALEITLGILLLVLAVVGWMLPIVSGWMFAIPGLYLLSRHFHWARRLRARARAARASWARRRRRARPPAASSVVTVAPGTGAVASGKGVGSGIDKNSLDCERQKV